MTQGLFAPNLGIASDAIIGTDAVHLEKKKKKKAAGKMTVPNMFG